MGNPCTQWKFEWEKLRWEIVHSYLITGEHPICNGMGASRRPQEGERAQPKGATLQVRAGSRNQSRGKCLTIGFGGRMGSHFSLVILGVVEEWGHNRWLIQTSRSQWNQLMGISSGCLRDVINKQSLGGPVIKVLEHETARQGVFGILRNHQPGRLVESSPLPWVLLDLLLKLQR